MQAVYEWKRVRHAAKTLRLCGYLDQERGRERVNQSRIFRATLKIHNNSPKMYRIWRRWQPHQVVPLGASLFPTHTCCFSVYSVVRRDRCTEGFSGRCGFIAPDLPFIIRTVPNLRNLCGAVPSDIRSETDQSVGTCTASQGFPGVDAASL
ncbi:uncharacterized protein LOC122259505 [Penaeus japonicus]|uniref:uncharacterized protein LOC122259505 n=1 Tax=Penaeus japonicus TaxID=27405 RepID=UPI001C70FE85|nr:uncharacterized protein LOC122259505 [Penaeus japonicus]